MYERVLQNTAVTLSQTFTEDGVTVDPGAVTVNVTREDGTALVTGGATTGTGAAARTWDLTLANSTALDVLKVEWVSPTKGTLVGYVEIRGGFLFSISDARALPPLDDTTAYPTADIIAARTMAEMALEDACGVAFVPTYNREKIDGDGTTDLLLEKPRPLSVVSATMGGTSIITTDLELYRDGRVYYANGWSPGRRNVEIKYAHGWASPPPGVGRACLKLAKWFLVDSAISDRATRTITPEGEQWLVTAGVRDAVFSIPEANSVVQQYGYDHGLGI